MVLLRWLVPTLVVSQANAGGILSCPHSHVMASDKILHCVALVRDDRNESVQVNFEDLGLEAGMGQTISDPSPSAEMSDSFSFTILAGDTSGKFTLSSSLSLSVFVFYVLAFPDDSKLDCDAEALEVSHSTECHITPMLRNQSIYAPANVFKPSFNVQFGRAEGLKFEPVLPLVLGNMFTFNLTAGPSSARLFITDGKTKLPYLLSVYTIPDTSTTIACEYRSNDTWSIRAGDTVACTLRPKVKRNAVIALSTAFSLKSTAESAVFSSLVGTPSSAFSDEFSFFFLPGRVTGQFSLSLGLGHSFPFYVYATPDFSSKFFCEDERVALSAYTRCAIFPSQNEAAVYALSSSFNVSVSSAVGGTVGELAPKDLPSQRFDFLFYAANASVGEVTLSVSGIMSPLLLSVVEAGRPKSTRLSCANSTMAVLSENYCTIVATEGGTEVWSKATSFVLSSTVGGTFAQVEPSIGKRFSFVYTSGGASGKGYLSDGIGSPFEITVMGDPNEQNLFLFYYVGLACLGVLVLCILSGRLYRCLRHRSDLKAARGQHIETSLLTSIEEDRSSMQEE